MAITTNLMKPCYCLKISRRRATGMKYLMLLFWYLCFGFLKVLSTLASLDFVESPFKQQNCAVFGKLRHFSEYFLLSTTTTPMPSFFYFFQLWCLFCLSECQQQFEINMAFLHGIILFSVFEVKEVNFE